MSGLLPIPGDGLPSPDARFLLRTRPWEARMSLWISTPELRETATGRVVLAFDDANWSAEAARWSDPTTLVLLLRRFPGGHVPALFDVRIDVDREVATVEETVVPLDVLERTLALRVRESSR